MPIGAMTAVPFVMYELSLVPPKPQYILDLGIGSGFYGAALRQWLDLGITRPRTYSPFEFVRLLGVEAYADYHNPCWDLYDSVVITNISAWLDWHALAVATVASGGYDTGPTVSLRSVDDPRRYLFDAVLLCDVLEHFTKDEGASVMTRLPWLVAPGGKLIISTPGEFLEQGCVHGNSYERHQSVWSAEELTAFTPPGYTCATLQNGDCDELGAKVVTVVFRRESECSTPMLR